MSLSEGIKAKVGSRYLRVAVIGFALVAGWLLFGVVRLATENRPASVVALLAAAIGGCVVFYRWQDVRAERLRGSTSRPVGLARWWLAPAVILAAFCAMGAQAGFSGRDSYLRAYCDYGARSQAQLDGCMSHVTTDDINKRDSQAARFARGETRECLGDAGPYCAHAARWNGVDPSGGP